ncbi:tetratricopeptide repeat protein 17 [Nematostella vectensis]|uniref:tetratricopeptide repeat protein 17 n=1 Tax=Nematostella vectensis TaxID=45351 RepID=UPI0020778D98|nr:tetratricopeptide repeat protein 17 [Nematostella vectensis]
MAAFYPWDSWRGLLILCVFFILLSSHPCSAVTHWVVTENGRIEQQASSVFIMNRPYDLVAFMTKEQEVKKAKKDQEHEEVYKNFHHQKLVNHGTMKEESEIVTDSDEDQAKEFFAKDPFCNKVKYRVTELSIDLLNVVPFAKKGINIEDHVNLKGKAPCLHVPMCKELTTVSLLSFDHLEGVNRRQRIPRVKDMGVTEVIPPGMSVEEWGSRLKLALDKNSTSWLLLNLAALYWRHHGSTYQTINCLRSALYHSPWNHRDVALTSLGVVLHKANRTLDALVLLHSSLEITQEVSKHCYVLGIMYSALKMFDMAEMCFRYVTTVEPSASVAKKWLKAVQCEKRFQCTKQERKRSAFQKKTVECNHEDLSKEEQGAAALLEIPYYFYKAQLEKLWHSVHSNSKTWALNKENNKNMKMKKNGKATEGINSKENQDNKAQAKKNTKNPDKDALRETDEIKPRNDLEKGLFGDQANTARESDLSLEEKKTQNTEENKEPKVQLVTPEEMKRYLDKARDTIARIRESMGDDKAGKDDCNAEDKISENHKQQTNDENDKESRARRGTEGKSASDNEKDLSRSAKSKNTKSKSKKKEDDAVKPSSSPKSPVNKSSANKGSTESNLVMKNTDDEKEVRKQVNSTPSQEIKKSQASDKRSAGIQKALGGSKSKLDPKEDECTNVEGIEGLMLKNKRFSAWVNLEHRGVDISKHVDFKEQLKGFPTPPLCRAKIRAGAWSLDHLEGIRKVEKQSLDPEIGMAQTLLAHDPHSPNKRIQDMGTHISRALEKDPTSWVALNLASLFWRIIGDTAEAVQCLRLAISHSKDKHRDVALVSLASILFRAGYLADAKTTCLHALKVSPNSLVGHFTLANILVAQNKITEATQHYLIVLQLESAFRPAVERLRIIQCIIWRQQKQLEKEAEELMKLLTAT